MISDFETFHRHEVSMSNSSGIRTNRDETQTPDFEMFSAKTEELPVGTRVIAPPFNHQKLLDPKDIHAIPGDIESRLGYSLQKGAVGPKVGWCFHRKDYHDDGSISDFWGVELTREQFIAIGGVELSVEPTLNTANVREDPTPNGP